MTQPSRNQTTTLILVLLLLAGVMFLCMAVTGATALWLTVFSRPDAARMTPTPAVQVPATATAETADAPPTQPSVTEVERDHPQVDVETAILTSVYERVSPSVVAVRVLDEDLLGTQEDGGIRPFFFSTGEGSGFVISEEGYIITNDHVIEGAEAIVVEFHDGIQAPAQVVGADPDTDLAVLKVDPEGLDLRPVAFGDIDELRVGDRLLVIGNPFGNVNTLTTGIVSALGRRINVPNTNYALPEVIQTDAAINPGNSGGPMLNARGEVVGVAFMIQSETRSNSGIGFGIPAYLAQRVARAIIEQGEFQYPFVGIRGTTLSPFAARALGLGVERGILIEEVLPDTPAEAAGLRGGDDARQIEGLTFFVGGDVIIAIDGQPVQVFDDLLAYLGRYTSPGDTITLTIYRDGETLDVPITLGVRP